MAGNHEFSVSTNLIKNKTALAEHDAWKKFDVVGHKGPNTQGTSAMMDHQTGIIYFTQVNRNAVACWDTKLKLNADTFREFLFSLKCNFWFDKQVILNYSIN